MDGDPHHVNSLADMFAVRGIGAPRQALLREGMQVAVGAVGGGAASPGIKRRVPAERARYAGHPAKYIYDILGWTITDQQAQIIEWADAYDRVIIASANNLGKDFVLGAWALYRYDAVAASPDTERGLGEQGCQLLLPAPDASTAFSTIYSAILEHKSRAESRGFAMPGRWSERSVLASVRPRWFIEAFSPPRDARGDVAHSASGRHHRNQVAIITEAQGVEERLVRATEGMCSGDGNKIVALLNPTLAAGPLFQREKTSAYKSLHLSAFDHPNVKRRAVLIPEAVSYRVIDSRVRNECRDRGPYPAVTPELEHGEFLYALPPRDDAEETGARADGIPGHPAGAVHVYRPAGVFEAQVLGSWPKQNDDSLFHAGSWDAAEARWRVRQPPEGPPDCVGFDVAREGGDDSVNVARWGGNAEALLRAYIDARSEGEKSLTDLLEHRRAYLGEPVILQAGNGTFVANQAHRRYPNSPWNVDQGGGESVIDIAKDVLHHRDVAEVSFAAAAPEPLPGMPWCENLRTWMYVSFAMLVLRGLVDVPPDSSLREECMAHYFIKKERVVQKVEPRRGMVKERVESVLLCPKDEMKKKLGRSPDRADAAVLALLGTVATPRVRVRRLAI